MIAGKKVLCIIPARSGSKGLPRKNVKLLAGKPLIAYTIEAALKSDFIDEILISTDDAEVVKISQSYGINIPNLRPLDLATDTTAMYSVVEYHLSRLEGEFGYLVLLQPTSPLRSEHHIDEAFCLLKEEKASSLVSFCLVDKHPFYMYRMEGRKMKGLYSNKNIVRRQDLSQIYSVNGAIFIMDIKTLNRNKKFILPSSVAYIMDRKFSVDIDDSLDFALCELVLKSMKRKN